MRKSSLEQFRHSRVSRPVRLSNQPEAERLSRSNAASSTSKKSGIPRPRTTSVEREMLVTAIPSSSSNRKHRRRSFSAESVYDYAHTPNIGIPGSSQRQSSRRTPMGSCRSQSVANSVMKRSSRKDTRPLMDKNFQAMELAKVRDYFQRHPPSKFTSVEVSARSMTLKLFVQLMSALLKKLFPQHVINMTNYTEEIPLLMRMLCYCGNIMRSWLVAANAPHSFPHVLGSVSWLVNLLDNTSGPLRYIEVEDLVSSSVEFLKACMQYHVRCYNLWNEKNVEDFTKHDEELKNSLEQMVGTNPEYSNALDQELKTVMKELNNPMELEEIRKLKALEEEFNLLEKQKSLLDENLHKVQVRERTICQKLEDVRKHNHMLAEGEKRRRAQLVDLQNAIEQQPMSIADKEHMLTEMTELRAIIKTQESQCEENKKNKYDNDMAIARLRGKINNDSLIYSNILRENTSHLLQLDNIQLEVQDLYHDLKRQADVDRCLHELKTSQNTRLRDASNRLMKIKFEEEKGAEQCTKDEEDLLSLQAQIKVRERSFKSFKADKKAIEVGLKEKIAALVAEIEALEKRQPDISQLQAEVTKQEETTNKYKACLTNLKNECNQSLKDHFQVYAEMFEKYIEEVTKVLSAKTKSDSDTDTDSDSEEIV